jgi:hypothetical protein
VELLEMSPLEARFSIENEQPALATDSLKLNCLIQRPALLAARAIHVRVVRINVTAFDAAEHAVIAWPWAEPTPPPL